MKEEVFTILGIIGAALLLIIVYPFIGFWIAYFGGWIAEMVIGDKLVIALNTLLGTAFEPHNLPMLAGALGWIGGYFKSSSFNAKK